MFKLYWKSLEDRIEFRSVAMLNQFFNVAEKESKIFETLVNYLYITIEQQLPITILTT